MHKIIFAIIFSFIVFVSKAQVQWPAITQENKPWTRWWWQGSAVNQKDLTLSLEKYKQAGLGGVEITPIYGVAGYEEEFINYLSPTWMQMLTHSLKEAARLDLGVDMATGTGWPFGGPWINAEDACKNIVVKTYTLNAGETLKEKVTFRQEPMVRTVGNTVYELHGIYKQEGDSVKGTMSEPLLKSNYRNIDISQLVEPISANKNLQALALDQIRFPKLLPIVVLIAYDENNQSIDITNKLSADGTLNWTAPGTSKNWTLYALFQGWHGKMVERAAPGGEGNVIDHFSAPALKTYLQYFDKAFTGYDINPIRAFFNDSYEVDDARGQSNWTPALLKEFKSRRGYDLSHNLPALFGKDSSEKRNRVLWDYRQTISELLLEKFTVPWRNWGVSKGAIIRNQSHGSPANILDLYAAIDIPETEGTDILRFKFATSAANVTGKKLASAEAATWLNEHFLSSLGDVKFSVDKYFLGGVNHIFYHGTNYSPLKETWPGWLFYAAVHFTPFNSFWKDFPTLNSYIARCQSFLQRGKPSNDILLYFPFNDRNSEPGPALLHHYDGMEGFDHTVFKTAAEYMLTNGYTFDLISDKQIGGIQASGSSLKTGDVNYQTLVLANSKFVTIETLSKLMQLASGGATIIFYKNLPESVPGFGDLGKKTTEFKKLLSRLQFNQTGNSNIKKATIGQGAFLLGEDLEQLLAFAKIKRELMVSKGLQFARRSYDNGHYYFISNMSQEAVHDWITLQSKNNSVSLFNPLTEKSGIAKTKKDTDGNLMVYLQLDPGETCILQTNKTKVTSKVYSYTKPAGEKQEVKGNWKITFLQGGPVLPAQVQTTELGSWTNLPGEEVKKFSGTASYSISLKNPSIQADGYLLDLGKVGESAEIKVNGIALATLIGPTYQLVIPSTALKSDNVIEIIVTNGMANRIADMDKRGVPWKKFYNVNFPARLSTNRNANGLFDASRWDPKESGLMGPVTITPVNDDTK
jgi:hypothetical protein